MATPITNKKIIEIGKYTLLHNSTVRQTAARFDISKSSVHTLLTRQLPAIDIDLYEKVKIVILTNKEERSIRGGLATKRKYEMFHANN